MLDNKGKKTFLIVVLAVSAVSLLAALVSAFVMSLNMMINMDKAYILNVGFTLGYGGSIVMLGGLLLGLFLLGLLFIVLSFALKGKIKLCSVIMSAITTVYVIAIAIVAYDKVPLIEISNKTFYSYYGYSVFETFISASLGVAVPMILSTISILLLSKLNDNEKPLVEIPDETKV